MMIVHRGNHTSRTFEPDRDLGSCHEDVHQRSSGVSCGITLRSTRVRAWPLATVSSGRGNIFPLGTPYSVLRTRAADQVRRDPPARLGVLIFQRSRIVLH